MVKSGIVEVSGLGTGCIKRSDADPSLINPLPIIGIIIGILLLRPLKGGGSSLMGLHYHHLPWCASCVWVPLEGCYRVEPDPQTKLWLVIMLRIMIVRPMGGLRFA